MKRLAVLAAPIAVGLIAAAALIPVPSVAGSSGSKGTLLIVSTNTTTQPPPIRVSLVDVASGKVRTVLQGEDLCCSGAWSPDAKWIALAKGSSVFLLGGDGREVAVMRGGAPISLIDASGHSRTLATVLPPSLFAGAWSPDGTKLAIAGAETSSSGKIRAADLEIVDPVGGPPTVLAKLPSGTQVTVLAWRLHAPNP